MYIKAFVSGAVLVGSLWGSISWGAYTDQRRATDYKLYADCIQYQYHMSPTRYYAEFNTVAVCDTD